MGRTTQSEPGAAPHGMQFQDGRLLCRHHAACRIQRAWRLSRWRRCFVDFARHQAFESSFGDAFCSKRSHFEKEFNVFFIFIPDRTYTCVVHLLAGGMAGELELA